MAKVPLRKYNSEIEALIDRGQADEAIAHARHILQTHPKHLETYRLLGKAYLETKRHVEATDIFNRILLSVPDDFVSHVGLSIIADESKRLDDAIWHMERAFEKQPSNAAIQAELQRLYGRRDGREPPKIRLTRGALAHMYVQGELYPAAIAEIRAVLAEEPTRADLKALLAVAYFRGGQKVDASETCSQLIGEFPYCFEANRVLVEILPGTGMAESVNAYKQRVIELDPYAAHARASVFQSADTPDAAVTLERLDYKGKPQEDADWDKSLALGPSTPASQPEWMKTGSLREPAAPFASTPESPLAFDAPPSASEPGASFPGESGPFGASEGGEQIPEWMKQAGWGESTGAFDESKASTESEPAEGELAKADLPDWIRSMAPAESPAPEPFAGAPKTDDTLDWLNKLDAANAAPPAPEGGFPDWMSGLGAAASVSASAPEDWMAKPSEPEKETPPLEPAAPAGLGSLGASAAEQDEAMAWLESLAAKQGAKSEELITDPNARFDSPPQWVEQAKAIGEAASEATETTPEAAPEGWLSNLDAPALSPAAATADWLSKLDETIQEETPPPADSAIPASIEDAAPAGLGSLGASAAEQDEAMSWLESLATKQGAKSEELITDPNTRFETPPQWVEQAKTIGEAATPPAEPPSLDSTGVWLRGLEEKESVPAKEEAPVWEREESIPAKPEEVDWAREFAAEAVKEEKPVEAAADRWSGDIEVVPPPTGPLAESESPAELPSWLRDMEQGEKESAPASVESLPDWLRGEEPEVPTPPAPTRPADWTPETPKPAPNPKPKPEPRKSERKPEPGPLAAEEKQKLRRTGMLPPLIDPALAAAREALSHGKIPDALQGYGNLIRKGKLLEDITFDLKEALYRFPVEVSIWQALGDAYMRANRLQDALDAYTKAEELLR